MTANLFSLKVFIGNFILYQKLRLAFGIGIPFLFLTLKMYSIRFLVELDVLFFILDPE